MQSFRDVMGRWETVAEFAGDLDVPYPTAAAWWQRNRIPGERWSAVAQAAEARGLDDITADLLASIGERRTEPTPPKRKRPSNGAEAVR